jgi:hypothetical protein
VVTFVPLWVSTKDKLPLGPTFTMCAALGVGVAPGGGVAIGVGVVLFPGCVGEVLLLHQTVVDRKRARRRNREKDLMGCLRRLVT